MPSDTECPVVGLLVPPFLRPASVPCGLASLVVLPGSLGLVVMTGKLWLLNPRTGPQAGEESRLPISSGQSRGLGALAYTQHTPKPPFLPLPSCRPAVSRCLLGKQPRRCTSAQLPVYR